MTETVESTQISVVRLFGQLEKGMFGKRPEKCGDEVKDYFGEKHS